MAKAKKQGGARKGAGAPRKNPADVFEVGSIRLTKAQWELFGKWGGAARLRSHLDKVKGGFAKNAKA